MACKGGTFQSGEDKYYPNAYYEIGDLFFTTRSENPNLRFGGTWELYGKGKVLVCVDPDDSDFSAVKKTGGEKEHKLTIEEMPKHNHIMYYNTEGDGYANSNSMSARATSPSYVQNTNWWISTQFEGKDQSHNNLQPYITCYIWIRIK